jgi:two-component sensor histidine kinase
MFVQGPTIRRKLKALSVDAATIDEPTTRPADLLITAALSRRPERAADLRAEVAAFGELSQVLAIDPCRAVRRFTQVALRLCNAGSAGFSLLRPNGSGQADFVWEAVSGALAAHEGGGTPRNFGPCGLCLDAGTTILLSRPEREFTYLARLQPTIFEALIVPLYDNARRPLGALWIVHHDPLGRFCVNDVRIMEQLAIQMVLALKLVQEGREHRSALASLESQRTAQQRVTRHLVDERTRRERAEVSEAGMRQAMIFKDVVVQEAHHRVKNTLQIAASVLSLHADATASLEVRGALRESFARLHLLAKVHELLYTETDSAQGIPMSKLLDAMGNALQRSFAEVSSRVNLQITSDPVLLDANDAIALALLANEALTNAYKHGFPDGLRGTITADLSCVLGDTIILRVADTGVGMRPDGAKGGLGMKLIRSFAEQLQGMLTVANAINATGTTLTLTIRDAAAGAAGESMRA